MADVQAPGHGRRRGVDREDLGAIADAAVEAVRALLLPGGGPPGFEALEDGLVGHGCTVGMNGGVCSCVLT
jgi:hypothetical protein